MNRVVVLEGAGVSTDRRAKLLKVLGGLVLLAALAAQANASPVGICLTNSGFGNGNISTAQYATAVVSAGCIPGFSSSLGSDGVVNPTSLAPGLTTATLTLTQPMTFGGNAVATSTASLNQGVLRDNSDTAGGLGGCGGTCTTTGGRAIAESAMSDNLHFTITNGASSAIVTFHADLDGTIGLEAGSNANNYNIMDEFILGGSGCWGSATGLGFQPCGSQNFGFLTSSFTNQSATGFDFTGTFQVTNGATDGFFAALNVDCQGGAACDFSNTASYSLSLPSNVTFTSDSGVLFSQTGTTAATPEPGTFGAVGVALLGAVALLRRSAKSRR